MTTTQHLILAGVTFYFSVGAFIAWGITRMSLGFTGKFEPMALAAFFAWPFFYIPGALWLALPYVAAVGAMVGLAYWLITLFR